MPPLQDLAGKRFGNLAVLHRAETTSYQHIMWMCQCDCGIRKKISGASLRKKNYSTVSCGCGQSRGSNNVNWTGVGEISGHEWNRIMSSARRRSIPFQVSQEESWNLFLSQERLCALSKMPISFSRHEGTTASLDRIDSSIGYIRDNIQWVHKDINLMKRSYSQDYFIAICKMVAELPRV